ncbi:MAG TPA: hypothetical protein VMV81_03255 [Phycisphaerae bacterium]|nr:hypothetical protein [Phycisphaerae bacterium]
MTDPTQVPRNNTSQRETVPEISFNSGRSGRRLSEKTGNPVLRLAIGFLVVAAFFLAMRYARGSVIPVVASVMIAVIVLSLVSQRGKLRPGLVGATSLPTNVNSRVQVFGRPDELARVADVTSEPFEPAIFERIYDGRWIPVGLVLAVILQIAISARFSVNGGAVGGLCMGFGQAIGWAFARLRPTYYRVSPGRLDIMQFNPLTNRATLLSEWPLKQIKLRIAFFSPTVDLDGDTRILKIKLSEVSEPYNFVQSLLSAAISESLAPPLPNDRLLG